MLHALIKKNFGYVVPPKAKYYRVQVGLTRIKSGDAARKRLEPPALGPS